MRSMSDRAMSSEDTPSRMDIGDFEQAATIRREAEWQLSMSERLARLNALCKQMSAVRGAARPS